MVSIQTLQHATQGSMTDWKQLTSTPGWEDAMAQAIWNKQVSPMFVCRSLRKLYDTLQSDIIRGPFCDWMNKQYTTPDDTFHRTLDKRTLNYLQWTLRQIQLKECLRHPDTAQFTLSSFSKFMTFVGPAQDTSQSSVWFAGTNIRPRDFILRTDEKGQFVFHVGGIDYSTSQWIAGIHRYSQHQMEAWGKQSGLTGLKLLKDVWVQEHVFIEEADARLTARLNDVGLAKTSKVILGAVNSIADVRNKNMKTSLWYALSQLDEKAMLSYMSTQYDIQPQMDKSNRLIEVLLALNQDKVEEFRWDRTFDTLQHFVNTHTSPRMKTMALPDLALDTFEF